MAIVYPASQDSFSVPSDPTTTSLSSAGGTARNHTQNHADLGLAIMALEANAALITHDHGGADSADTGPAGKSQKLLQSNTHQSPDTDQTIVSLHHTIGSGPTQAAAGNHAHDYNGPSIFNKPFIICTSTTRPINPNPGTMIWETDTNCARVWSAFSNNTYTPPVPGPTVEYTYKFDSDNNSNSLDPSVFSQVYPIGTPGTGTLQGGVLCAPSVGKARIQGGASFGLEQLYAQAFVVESGFAITATDDQVMTMGTDGSMSGETLWQEIFGGQGPSNDGFLRVSADRQSYVRYQVSNAGVAIYYTTTGQAGETVLGATAARTVGVSSDWEFDAIGNTYYIKQNGQEVLSVVDNNNAVSVGPDNRGWGFGQYMSSSVSGLPAYTTYIGITDSFYYVSGGITTSFIWQLLAMGNVPHVRTEAHFEQSVAPGAPFPLSWDTIIWDWFIDNFTNLDVDSTAITIQESGHYFIHGSVCWDSNFPYLDNAKVEITVNGLSIGRKSWNFLRGNGFFPGFNQSQEVSFTYYLAAGETIRLQASHNAIKPCWLASDNVNKQWCSLDVQFTGP